jgi:uncharacterized protein
MNVIIMGGSGMIGKAFTRELLTNGHSVWILSRRLRKAVAPSGASVRGWDGHSSNGWMDLVEQSDALVNLAGESIGAWPWTAEHKRKILTSRLDAGRAVVEAVGSAQHKPLVVMQSSAVGIYGPAENTTFTESSPPGSDFLARVAVQWEDSSKAVEEMDTNRIVIRTGLVLDRKEGLLSRFLLPYKLFVGGPMGSGRQVISWIHIRDLVQSMRFLLEKKEAHGVYNVCAPEPVSNAEFGREIARALRRPYWFPIPGFALRIVLGEMSTLVLNGQRVEPARLKEEGYHFVYSKLSDALDDLLHRRA